MRVHVSRWNELRYPILVPEGEGSFRSAARSFSPKAQLISFEVAAHMVIPLHFTVGGILYRVTDSKAPKQLEVCLVTLGMLNKPKIVYLLAEHYDGQSSYCGEVDHR